MALIGRFHYAGNVVYLDHGGGLTSGCLHWVARYGTVPLDAMTLVGGERGEGRGSRGRAPLPSPLSRLPSPHYGSINSLTPAGSTSPKYSRRSTSSSAARSASRS